MRSVNFHGHPGLGEVITEPDTDPEFAQFMGDLGLGSDEINFAEEGG